MIRYDPTPEDVRDHLLHCNLYIATGPSRERYFEATISTLRNFPLQHGIPHIVQELGAHDRPVLFCWGTDDDVVPYSNSQVCLCYFSLSLSLSLSCIHSPGPLDIPPPTPYRNSCVTCPRPLLKLWTTAAICVTRKNPRNFMPSWMSS
eukprot:TRINITY_DN1047_c0_g1_i4.p1 TRINITY_DN1047_c0_g1~~TRINITY_DN1047_c0_g1_i4.p1  ORF type:complete len:148 (-),score=3.01 TRINITY_DN1047_c0_g1_i4:92-535(-)